MHTQKTRSFFDFQCVWVLEHEDQLQHSESTNYKWKVDSLVGAYEGFSYNAYEMHTNTNYSQTHI